MARSLDGRRAGAFPVPPVILWGYLLVVSLPGAGPAGRVHAAADDQVGARVILRSREASLKVGSSIIARGDVHRVYRVERANPPWLWLVAGDVRGWARDTDVLPLERAVDHFTAEIRDHPQSAWAYQMRGLVRFDREEYNQAIADLDVAIRLDPKQPLAYSNRGSAFFARREFPLAIADYNEAIKLAPNDADAYLSRARAWLALNEQDLAIADLSEAIRLLPSELPLYRLRAQIRLTQHQYQRALEDYDRILQLAPADAAAHNGRAWIWATAAEDALRSGPKAIAEATRACMLSGWKDPYGLGTLAAAYAEAGDFLNAITWQTRALEQFPHDDPALEDHRRRLALYQERRPWREVETLRR